MPRVLLHAEKNHPILGNLLDERYQIIQVLSAGAFGRTYLAEDIITIGNPRCLIKHLKPASNDSNFLQTVRHLFVSQTNTLNSLGEHEQIPQVLGYFQDDQGFYLVQEFIPGLPLNALLPTSQRCGKRWSEKQVIQLLQEVLAILEFVHSHNVIHCDIKPNNIIKRASDGKYCLIEFGAIKPIRKPLLNDPKHLDLNVSFAPAGYVPPEQLAYQPQPNSDIYALGNIAIQALSGLHPAQLQIDADKQKWHRQLQVSEQLVSVLNQMVRYHCQDRYQSATEALDALQYFVMRSQESKVSNKEPEATTRDLEVVDQELDPKSVDIPHICLNAPVEESPATTGGVEVSINEIRNLTLEDEDTSLQASVQEPQLVTSCLLAADAQVSTQEATQIYAESSSLETTEFVASETEISQLDASEKTAENGQEVSPNSNPSKQSFRSRRIPVALAGFGIGIAANALVMLGGFLYLSQPDQSKFKQVDQFINQVHLEEGAKKLCNLPYICFWEKKQKPNVRQTQAEVYQLMKQAYEKAAAKDFSGALKYLEQISPQAPDYAKVKAKISEYQKKLQIKSSADKSAKLTADRRGANR